MSELDSQAVADKPDDEASPSSGVSDARKGDDLDTLLSQYDDADQAPGARGEALESSSNRKPEPASVAPDTDKLNELYDWHKQQQQAAFERDVENAINAVRGDLDSEIFDNGMVRGWLDDRVKENPKLQRAWMERHANPKHFERVLAELGRDFEKRKARMFDPAASDDRAAVAAAVRGASTRAPEESAPNFSKMMNGDFAAEVEKKYGFRPI